MSMVRSALEGSASVKSAGRLLLVTMMLDDSESMFMAPDRARNTLAGYNGLLASMQSSDEAKRTMLQTRFLNGRQFQKFMPLAQCRGMESVEYFSSPNGTPLYSQSLILLGTVMAKTEELIERGAKQVRSATLIMTDGEPTDMTDDDQKALFDLVKDMRNVGDHIVAGMGVGTSTSFTPTFRSMGIADKYIFSAANRDEILKSFRMFAEVSVAHSTSTDLASR